MSVRPDEACVNGLPSHFLIAVGDHPAILNAATRSEDYLTRCRGYAKNIPSTAQ